jgi:phosphoribosylformylglycinamidine cyclo-ligase
VAGDRRSHRKAVVTADTSRPHHTYLDAGVDLDASEEIVRRIGPIAKATHGPEVLSGVGPFGGMYKLAGYTEPVLVSSTDSVGTKVKIAALLGRYDTIGIDLVNQSVNDIITTGATPLFFLDYIASSSLTLEQKTSLVEGVAGACSEAGCALIGGETADMPDMYAPGDLDFVGFVVGAVERDEIVDGSSIAAGDELVALPSSGLHTNGYSLVRKVFGVGIDQDAGVERERLKQHEPELGMSLGDALLAPHRSYVAEAAAVRGHVKGIGHITGGGLVDNVPRVLPQSLGARIDASSWERPPLFALIQREGNIDESEMYRTFNMGVGLVLVVSADKVEGVLADLPGAWVLGEVRQQDDQGRVSIE